MVKNKFLVKVFVTVLMVSVLVFSSVANTYALISSAGAYNTIITANTAMRIIGSRHFYSIAANTTNAKALTASRVNRKVKLSSTYLTVLKKFYVPKTKSDSYVNKYVPKATTFVYRVSIKNSSNVLVVAAKK